MKNTLKMLMLLTAFYSSESSASCIATKINQLNEAPKFTAEQTIPCILLLTNVFHLLLQERYPKADYKQIQDIIKKVWVSKIKAPEMEGVEIWRVPSRDEEMRWLTRSKSDNPESEKRIQHLYHYINYYHALEHILYFSYKDENLPYRSLEDISGEFKRVYQERNRHNHNRSRITPLCDFIHSGNKYLNRMFYDLAKIYNLMKEHYTTDLPALKVPQ